MKCILAFSPRWHWGPYLSCPASFIFGQFCSKFNIRKTLQARPTIPLQDNRPVTKFHPAHVFLRLYKANYTVMRDLAEIVKKNWLSSAQSCLITSGQKLPLLLAVPSPFYRYYGLTVLWCGLVEYDSLVCEKWWEELI